MHIAMLSDYETQGGAAVAASRLAKELCKRHRVTRLVFFPDGAVHPWRTISLGQESWIIRTARRLRRKLLRPDLPLPQSPEDAATRLERCLRKLSPDIVHLHNLHGGAAWGWGPHLAEVCTTIAPVVWTLHDMWSFTGRCAYAYDCVRFRTGCDGSCPTPDEAPPLPPERIAPAWHARRRLLERCPHLLAVTPSNWLARQALSGLWADHRVKVIANGIPTDLFRPLDRRAARQALGLPPDGTLVLVVAQDLGERRKGATFFPELWRYVSEPVSLLTMGKGELPGPNPHTLGVVDSTERKVLAYNAADLLLHPAPVDNLPNVVLEAIACGTPVVALPVGGLPEIVVPGQTGWLAAHATAAALGRTLNQALVEVRTGDLRWSCRERAQADFSSKRQAARLEIVYREMRRRCPAEGPNVCRITKTGLACGAEHLQHDARPAR